MSTFRTILCLSLIFTGVRPAAQETELVLDPETGLVLSVSELVIEPGDIEQGWLELTPLVSHEAPAVRIKLGDRTSEDEELRLRPEVPPGASLLCTGGGGAGVLCEQIFLQGEAWVEPGESLAAPVRFEPGLAVHGRYLLDGWPIAGARVSVVPTGLSTDRPFTMPLGLEQKSTEMPKLWREVTSDDDGYFVLPRLAQGEYFLEAMLPSGRLHRGEPFGLPNPGDPVLQADVGTGETLVWDLGEIDVADGLVVEFQVTNLQGESIGGAAVAGRQGETPGDLISYQALVDGDGVGRLSGFSVEQGVHLSCHKPGYRTFEQHYSLLPVLVSCVLEPLATVRGEVLGIDGVPPSGAIVSFERVTAEPLETGSTDARTRSLPSPVAVDAEGRFTVGELAAGEYRLQAAAPGFGVEERTFVLEPGQMWDLEAVILLHGRGLAGRVVDAETQEPIAGVEIRAVSPPGAAFEVTDEDGEFVLATRIKEPLVLKLSVADDVASDDVASDDVASDYVGREISLSPARLNEREPLLFTLERGGRIRVVVLDEETGLPCQSCRLVIRPTSEELMTGSAGEALSAPLAPGWYRVQRPRVSHLGSTVVAREDAEVRHARVRLEEITTLRFGERRRTVQIDFQPSPGVGWSLSARTQARIERYDPEPGGGFKVRHRSGESLELFLHRFEPETGAEVEVRQTLLPAEIETDALRLPLATGLLSGRATSDGEPLSAVKIRLRTLELATRATVYSRSDGTFQIPHLPAGVYAVVVGERNVQFISLRSGQSLDLGTYDLTAGSY